MSLKTRLVSLISAFALILTMLIMGVLAVSQVNVNMGGNISFTADDVYAHVTGNVTGATVLPSVLDVTYSATQTTGDDTVWEELNLNFDTSATPIVFSITVDNLSTERTLTVTLTDTIASETPNLLKTITTTSEAYTSGDIITLDPQGQVNDTVQFTLTLSVKDKDTSLSNASFDYDLQLFDASVAPEPPASPSDFKYSISGNNATITAYNGSDANLVIPSTFSIVDGQYVEGSDYIVTAIGFRAFYNCTSMTNITIPESVTSIGEDAFRYCNALTDVNFGENSQLTSIEGHAFYYCSALTEVNFGEDSQLTSIGIYAFYQCDTLTSITIPDSVTSIGEGAFVLCYSLTSITIPDSVTSIGVDAFSGCYALAEVYNYSSFTIDDTTSNGKLGYYAQVIYNASDLEGAKPATKIENDGTMQYYVDGATRIALAPAVPRESLTSVTLHPDTTEINQYAFYYCTSMTNITIPESVISIGGRAFYYCDALTEVNFGADSLLKSIGERAFYLCNNLTSITIPEGVTSINGDYTFEDCTSLATVTIDSDDIYEDVTSNTTCGELIANATTIRVLASIIDSGLYKNDYLNGSTFEKSPTEVDGYYVFTKR